MYNGIGLQTARGSGTNGYVQTNKFFVRPRTGGKPVNGGKGFEDDQGTAGLSKKPNKDILEHDRKRQIHLKLAILEDKLADQGYSDAEIALKLEEASVNLEAAAAVSEERDAPGDLKISDTQTHQVAARKEKQMEAFRAALGLPDQQQPEEGIIDDEPTGEAYEGGLGRLKERREHSFLDRDSGRKLDLDVDEKDGKGKESKKQRGHDDMDEMKRRKKKESKKRRHDDSSESDEHGRDRRRRSKKKAKGRKQDSDTESDFSSSDSDSDSDMGEKRRKATNKRSRSKRSVSSESEEVESDDSKKHKKSHKKFRPSNRSGSKETRDNHYERRRDGQNRHDADVSEPESDDNKQQLLKKEPYHGGGRKQKRDEEDVETNHLKDRYRDDSGGKKTARDSDDSETEYENKKQLRSKVVAYSGGMKQWTEEEAVSKHGKDRYRSDSGSKKVARESDDSEAEYENRRQLKDESLQIGRKHKREEDEDYNNHGRDRYRSDDTGKEDDDDDDDDRYRGRDNDKGDDDRDRYRQRCETVNEDDEDYKRGRDRYRYRGDKRRETDKEEDEDDERVRRERGYSNKGRSHYNGRSSGKRSSYGDRD